MRPIQESIEVARELTTELGEHHYLSSIQDMGDLVQQLVPACVGLTVAWTNDNVVFTLVATADEIAQLDAMQYLDSGPCVEALYADHGIITTGVDLMDEDAWRRFAQATSAAGVKSTLTLPLMEAGEVTGTINLYAATDNAFEGHIQALAQLLGAWAPGVVHNADLAFTTKTRAQAAPKTLREERSINTATGLIAAADKIAMHVAHERLLDAAHRAGIPAAQLAEALIALSSGQGKDG